MRGFLTVKGGGASSSEEASTMRRGGRDDDCAALTTGEKLPGALDWVGVPVVWDMVVRLCYEMHRCFT